MTYEFEIPRVVTVTFSPRSDGFCKRPLLIRTCVGVKTGKSVIVKFIARDKRIHRHRYHHSMIQSITSDSEVIFEAKRRIPTEQKSKPNAQPIKRKVKIYKKREFNPILNYRDSGVHSGL